jgi:hypothetical protein
MATREQRGSALPAHRAFVVHFAADDGRARRRFAGRAEHLSSGESIHFSSLKQLLAFIGSRVDAAQRIDQLEEGM